MRVVPNVIMGKTVKARRSLRFAGQFERQCRCLLHDDNIHSRLYRTAGKEFEKSKLTYLIQEKLISPRAQWVCSNCLTYRSKTSEWDTPNVTQNSIFETSGKSNISASNSSGIESEASAYSIDHLNNVISALKAGQIQGNDLTMLYKAVGDSLRSVIAEDMTKLSSVYKDINSISDLNCKTFLEDRPADLIDLLNTICNVEPATASNKKLSAYCHLIEQLYFLRNLNFIGPFSFSNNIVKWCFAGSRACVTVDGATSAAGSITSMKKVLKDASVDENRCFDSGDVDVFFDNTQRIGKTRRVREGGSTPMDVATNVVFLQNGDATTIQQNEDLMPEVWESNNPDNVETLHDSCVTKFNHYKRDTQENLQTKVASEVFYDTECLEYKDHVSIKSTTHSLGIDKNVCVKCAKIFENTLRTCPNCKHDANFYEDRSTLYDDVPSAHRELPAKVKMGEIIGLNPNSRESVKAVIKNILKQCNVGEHRKWIRIGCDGVPYSIADSLIDSLVVCCICKEEIDLRKQSFELHIIQSHSGIENVSYKKIFGNILLTPGAGHIEINLLRSCFSLCRHIFIEHIAQMLGFCSAKAKEFIVSCGNHHLSWQVAMIIFHAFSQEITYVYIIECFKNKEKPSLLGFLAWKRQVKNVNVLFYYDLIFNIFLGLKCFRSGIRKNNSQYSLAGRQIASLVFFMGKHRIYQRLLCRDLAMRSSAPRLVNDYLEATESYTISGDHTKGEGGDYITENQNKILKKHLPPGVPTLNSWQTASRCDENLRKIRESLFHRLDMKDPGNEDTVTLCHDYEIQMLRREIRSSKLFENVYEEGCLKALNGSQIHENLLYFMATANDNLYSYMKNGKDADLTPIFTTYAEEEAYNDINTWTLKKIKSEIQTVIKSFPDENLECVYMELYKQNVEKQNKRCHIQYLEEVRAAKESLLSASDDVMIN